MSNITSKEIYRVIDANSNRAAEGCRVLEEYARFIIQNKDLTETLKTIRHTINEIEPHKQQNVAARDTSQDMRAGEAPQQRQDLRDLIIANAKRVQEALRTLEEYTKKTTYTHLRYQVYDIEKALLETLPPHPLKGIYVISDNCDTLSDALEKGADIIQLRGKSDTKETLLNKALEMAPKAKKANTPFIVNDHLDIALLSDADGLHTGQDDLPINEIQKCLGPNKILGRTTHTLEQGITAQEQGATYISIGPIWETPSKPNRDGIGLDYLKKAPDHIHIPYVAIGGINAQNVGQIEPFNPPMIGVIRAYKDLLK